jgi:hypothetical protein
MIGVYAIPEPTTMALGMIVKLLQQGQPVAKPLQKAAVTRFSAKS